MENKKRKFSWWITLFAFFVTLYFVAALYESPGKKFESWMLLFIIMAWFGLIGAVIGGMLGGIIGLIAKLFKKNIFILGLKYGAAIGYMGLLITWFLGCWINGTICLPQ